MAILASDTFTRADNADLGTAWDVMTGEGPLRIVSNTVQPTALDTDSTETNNAATWPADQYVEASISDSGTISTAGIGVAVRGATAAQTYYRVVMNHATTGAVIVAKLVAAAYTQIAARDITWTNPCILRLEVAGTTLKVFVNGVQQGANITDAAIASGRPGISYSSTEPSTTSVDDWQAGDFTVAALPWRWSTQTMTPAVQRAAYW